VIAVRERPAIVTVATASLRDLAHVRPRHMAALATVPQDPSGGERNMLTSLAATRRRPHMLESSALRCRIIMLGGAYPCALFVINAVLVLWRRILSRCAPIA